MSLSLHLSLLLLPARGCPSVGRRRLVCPAAPSVESNTSQGPSPVTAEHVTLSAWSRDCQLQIM